MRRTEAVLAILGLSTAAHAYHGDQPIPWVKSVVASMTREFAACVTYSGPHGGYDPTQTKPCPTSKPTTTPGSYWLADIKHQGVAAFNSNTSYQVFRNIKDFGAKGDGMTDDTAAINLAISTGARCAPGKCSSTTTAPAIIYVPAGTYLISSSIIDYYQTNIIGNPNDLPILKATANFTGLGLIDGDVYGANGLSFGATNVFFRQVRNLIFDMTDIPASSAATGLHWPTAQATSLQNCVFLMSDAPDTQHQGVFIEDGSGGFMNDLVFYGGYKATVFGNQQFTMRNLTFYNAVTAISQIWDWGWTYKGIRITNCSVGLDMSAGGRDAQSVGSVTFIDSSISNTKVGIVTAHDATSQADTAGSLILENVQLRNVSIVIQGPGNTTVIEGSVGSLNIAGWGQGHSYSPSGPVEFENFIEPFSRPNSLLAGSGFYERSKPQYADLPVSRFISARSVGAKGDGVTDDTVAVNRVIQLAVASGKIAFFDAGTYKVTSTIHIAQNSKVVGEAYAVILGAGNFFSNMAKPQPVVQVGSPGESGSVEWSDMIISTQGATAGAILIEWNLSSSASAPSGMWDVHTRIGGHAGSNLQLADCPTMTTPVTVDKKCIAAFMSMRITKSAAGLYMENVWMWTADHDIEDPQLRRITIYAGRGLLVESKAGNIWLVATAVEHHVLYQYQFSSTQNIFMGQIQTETAYYQPNPPANLPFPPVTSIDDPDFAAYCANRNGTCGSGWGLRVLDTKNLLVYGAGLYSFFSNYSTSCSVKGNGEICQTQIFAIDEGGPSSSSSKAESEVYVYNLNTIGSVSMVNAAGKSLASYADNINVFPDTIALFHT